ncbi:LysR substrate-binding domain-containing protein [Comamonas humi]
MKTHLLRYFVVLAEELHYGRAAAKLSITQPPLSVAIKALEDELGVRLFERNAKQVQLTEAGAAFLVEARRVLGQLQHAADVARQVAEGRQGQLAIGVAASMIYRDVPRVLQAFARQRPDIEITLHEMSTAEQQQAVARGQLQGGFVNIVTPAPGLDSCPIAPEPLVCCLPEAHPLAGEAEIDLRALAHERFVMFVREVSPAHYDDVIACLHSAGIHPRIHHAVRQWFSVIALVAMGQGVALVPACMQRAGMAGVRWLPLQRDGGRPALTAGAFVWRAPAASASLQALISVVRER